MAVSVDTNPATDQNSTATTNTSFSYTGLTTHTGSNAAIVVAVYFGVKTVSGVTVKWDTAGANQSFTSISSQATAGSNGMVQLWGLVNPGSVGNKTISLAWTTGSDICVAAVSYFGVDQTGGATSFVAATPATGNTATGTITITSAVGNETMACICTQFQGITAHNQTSVFLDNAATGGASASIAAGAASNTHTSTQTADQWAAVGVNIVAASGVTTVIPPSWELPPDMGQGSVGY